MGQANHRKVPVNLRVFVCNGHFVRSIFVGWNFRAHKDISTRVFFTKRIFCKSFYVQKVLRANKFAELSNISFWPLIVIVSPLVYN